MRYAPPPVRHPVGRPVAGASPAACAGLACSAAWIAWAWQAPFFDSRVIAGAVVGAAALAWAFADWHAAPRGWLAWNGAHWHWQSRLAATGDATAHAAEGDSPPGGCDVRPALHLDLQAVMLVRLRPAGAANGGACPRWLWLERRRSPESWADLRRAVLHASQVPAAADGGAGSGAERAAS